MTMDLTVYDDPTLAWYATVVAASNSATPSGLRVTTANGAKVVANAYWSINRMPSMTKNEVLTTKVSLSFSSSPSRYAS